MSLKYTYDFLIGIPMNADILYHAGKVAALIYNSTGVEPENPYEDSTITESADNSTNFEQWMNGFTDTLDKLTTPDFFDLSQYKKPVYAVKSENGQIEIINGTSCSKGYCREYGCDFPYCATFSGEKFDTEELAKETYPDLIMV